MNITPEVMKLIEKTDHALEVAEILFEQGYSSDSCQAKFIMLCSMRLRRC